ncbi:ependymin-like [Centroberyx gerrardi]|uniref:ependymin-like n=1 Tax=Centroberyx gerrardi TaxID=166262 RepID=UPI003AB0114C
MNLMADAKYVYDAYGQRIRMKEIGTYDNTTFHYDGLLNYKEHVMYLINEQDRTCVKQPLKGDFKLMEIPHNATLLAAIILGSSSAPLDGLEVSTWIGETQEKAKYLISATVFGCIPVNTFYHTDKTGWVTISFYDNVIGVENPEELYPPPYCQGVQLRDESSDFYSLFEKH